LPPELSTIGSKLNDLLKRLQDGFARERRISAAVAHELRTPLAKLQSLCEVTLHWPQDDEASAKALGEALTIAEEMHLIVESLMVLA
jgi:signal transduction histidine kinase